MTTTIKHQNYKYSIRNPDTFRAEVQAVDLESATPPIINEGLNQKKPWYKKLSDFRDRFFDNQKEASPQSQILDNEENHELDDFSNVETNSGEGLKGILNKLKKKFGKTETSSEDVEEIKNTIEKLKLSNADKAKIAMLALAALGLSAVAINAAIPVMFGTTVGGVLGTGFGTFGANLMGSQVLGFGAIQGVNSVAYGAAATAAKWYAGAIATSASVGAFKAGKSIFNKINNGSEAIDPNSFGENRKRKSKDQLRAENNAAKIEQALINDDYDDWANYSMDEVKRIDKFSSWKDVEYDDYGLNYEGFEAAKTQRLQTPSNVQAEAAPKRTRTLEQVNQESIEIGLASGDYGVWFEAMKSEIYRTTPDRNNIDLSKFKISPKDFADAKQIYAQNKVHQLNNTFNQPPAVVTPESPATAPNAAEDLDSDLKQSMDRINDYQIEIAKLQNQRQAPITKKQIKNLEAAVAEEQAKINKIEQKLPTPKPPTKPQNSGPTIPLIPKIEQNQTQTAEGIQTDLDYAEKDLAEAEKQLENSKNKPGNNINRLALDSWNRVVQLGRAKVAELKQKLNNSSKIPTTEKPIESLGVDLEDQVSSQVAEVEENVLKTVESNITPEQREEVTKYLEDKIASKYRITTFEQGIANNGELSEQDPIEKMKNSQEITIGDLHGDIKKLIESLVLSEMAYLSKEDLAGLYLITENGNNNGNYTNPDKMKELSDILSQVEWTGGDREFKLVGDVLSDRNGNDWVMVKHINELRRKGANITTLSGNHDHNAFLPNNGILGGRSDSQADSMLNARESTGFQSQADYFADPIIQKEYLEYAKDLKVFDYNTETQTLISHAPIFEKTFQQWHKILLHKKVIIETDYNKLNLEDFSDKLNSFYQEYVKELILKGQSSKSLEDYLMNEDTALLFARNGGEDGESDDLPTFHGQIKVLVNGHNTCDESPTSSGGLIGNSEFTNICLDNSAGKRDGENGYDSPLYLVPNYKINSAPVTPTTPRQFPIPPLPQSFTQLNQPDSSVNSEPEILSDNTAVESKENIPFDPNSYKNAAQNFINNAFSNKLEKLKLENEIKTFTKDNWGYNDRIFSNSAGQETSQKAFEFAILSSSLGDNIKKSGSFEGFLDSTLDHISYVSNGSIFRNYKYNSFMYLLLSRMDQSVSKEIINYCKTYPSEGFGKNRSDKENFLSNLKSSGKMDQYQKAFQDVLASI